MTTYRNVLDLEEYLKQKKNYSNQELNEILNTAIEKDGDGSFYKEALEAEVYQLDGDMNTFDTWAEKLGYLEEPEERLNEIVD
jgi:hypothetical protein